MSRTRSSRRHPSVRLERLEDRTTPAILFSSAGNVATAAGTFSTGLATVDFNRDGKQDLAVTTYNAGAVVRVFLGNGNGTFDAGTDFALGGADAEGIAAADFDADGDLDLAVGQYSSDNVRILQNDYATGGTFAVTQTLTTGDGPTGVAAGDLNQDGRPDLVVSNFNANTVSIFFNTDVAATPFPTTATQTRTLGGATNPEYIAIADFDGDGAVNFAVACQGTGNVAVFGNSGPGGGTPFALNFNASYATGSGTTGITLGDFNKDGDPDLAVTNLGDDNVSVLFGNDGTAGIGFGTAVNFAIGDLPIGITAADLDGDGNLDLAVALVNDSQVAVLSGNGTSFTSPGIARFATVTGANQIAAADFDGNGFKDLAVSQYDQGNQVGILRNGNQPPPVTIVSPMLLVGGSTDGKALEYTAVAGSFAAGVPFDFFPGFAGNVRTATADVNGDGTPDLIGATGPGTTARVVILDGVTKARIAAFDVFGGFTGGLYVAAADFDRDGKAEVVVTPDQGGGPRVSVYRGADLAAGAATVVADFLGLADQAGVADDTFRGGIRPAVGDVTGDGVPDLVVAAGFLGGPRVTVWNGAGIAAAGGNRNKPTINPLANFFAFEQTLRNGAFATVGDVTGDGKADLIFGGGPNGSPRVRVINSAVFLAAGGGTNLDDIPAAQVANFFAGDPNTRGGVRLAARDGNGDNVADIITGSGEGLRSEVRLYSGAAVLGASNPSPAQVFDPFATILANGVYVG